MRITRIRIRSFGGIRDRDYRVDEGMTVFHGPNESGKTSTMEFIRSVLSPTNAKKLYPARNKSDNGILDIVDGDSVKEIRYDSKKVIGDVPAEVRGIDPALFREIFAMDPDTLDKSDSITKGEIKKRFLTVPGGDRLPEAIKWVDDEVKDVVGLRSNSSSKLLRINESISRTEAEVADMKRRADEYGDLADKAAKLKAQKEALQQSGDEEVTGWDISEDALKIAQGNVALLDAGNVKIEYQDALKLAETSDAGRWNIIVSNPPYICEKEKVDMEKNVLEHEPGIALFVPDEEPLKFYRAIAEYASSALKSGGALYFEINPIYEKETREMLEGLGFKAIDTKEDAFGKQRMMRAGKS